MSDVKEKVSYLRGLAAGMKLNMEKDSNKLIVQMMSVLEDLADALDEANDKIEELSSYVDEIDDDLSDLEDVIYDEDEDKDDFDPSEFEDDCDALFGDDEDDDDDTVIQYNCPNCGYALTFNLSKMDFEGANLCPKCGMPIFPEITEKGSPANVSGRIRIASELGEDDNGASSSEFNPFDVRF